MTYPKGELTVPVMARHIKDLVRAFDVAVNVVPQLPPECAGAGELIEVCGHEVNPTGRKGIMIAPVSDECRYAVALHEIGHCVDPMGMLTLEKSEHWRKTGQPSTLRDLSLQLEEERAAWRWARRMALDWTIAMEQVMTIGLSSYVNKVRRITGRVP